MTNSRCPAERAAKPVGGQCGCGKKHEPAGQSAALYGGRSRIPTLVLERGIPGGQLWNTAEVEDYPGFETVLGAELAEKFHTHAAKFGAVFKTGVTVTTVRKRVKLSASELFEQLVKEVKDFSSDNEFEDDVCLVGMEAARLGHLREGGGLP